jgi:hypothetical protein
MPTWMKVLLVVGGLVVLLIVATVVGGYFVVRRYGPGLVEAGKQTVSEGAEYGRHTDNEGCRTEAVARQARAEGVTDAIKHGFFVRACLETSRPTPGFCDGVPRHDEFMKIIAWHAEQCQRYGLKSQQQCGQVFEQVQQYCEMRARRGNVNANEGAEPTGNDQPPPPAPRPPPAPAR